MIPARNIEHVGQGLALMINQYQDRPRFAAWARAYLKQCQLLEDAIYDVLIKRLIQNAEGVQVDAIGRIVGEFRRGLDDATYKVFIAARVRINRSRGNTMDVLEVMGMITATSVIFGEYIPACLFIEALTILDQEAVLVYTMLHDTKAAGVKLSMIVPTTNSLAFRPMSVYESATGIDGDIDASLLPNILTFHSPGATFPPGLAGGTITISGAASAANNGTFPITTWIDATHIRYTNLAAVDADVNNGSISYAASNGVVPAANDPTHACGDANNTNAELISDSDTFVLEDGMVFEAYFDGVLSSFTFLEEDFVDITEATAEEVIAVLQRERRRYFRADPIQTRATLECTLDEPYDFSALPYTFVVSIDGGAPQAMLFSGGTLFPILGAVTAEQVAAHLQANLTGVDVTATSGGTKITLTSQEYGHGSSIEVGAAPGFGTDANDTLGFSTSLVTGASTIKLSTYRLGTTTSIQVVGSDAATALGFDTSLIQGEGDSTFGLLSDAVTVRDPNAEPITAPPGVPVIIYVDPGSTP